MKKFILFIGLLCMQQAVYSQASPCNVQAFASPVEISCGEEVVLSAFGNGSGNIAFQENFNSGSPVGWQFTQTVTIANNTCGVPAPDGSPFMWMGDASVNPRDMTTVAFDLTLGGTICFEMRYSIQADASPCEGPDEPQEGVYLQYSINGGANWVNIDYWDPNGGNDPQLVNWNQYCLVIPPAAMTPNTMIRWHQDAVSGAEYDHWGIDNVIITLNDPNFVINWLHDGYSYGPGSSGGNNPTPVSPQTTTTYNVQITDGTTTCTDAIQVIVNDPVIIVSAGNDTTICPGECVTLNGDAYWQIQAPGLITFVNDVSQTISAGIGGGPIEIPIVVSGLNIPTIQPGSITEVCITSMSYFGQNIFPPSTLTVGSFEINLTCPGGTSIQLIPAGITTSTFILPGYVQTCFNMTTANDIALSAPPYTNTFAPEESFNNLTGCAANGQWTMSLETSAGLGFGTGEFGGWSITFDDPGLTAPVSFVWSPLLNMTNENTLSPTVCPLFTTTYTLTATNHPGCLPQSDDVTITVPNTCCQLQLDNVIIQQPTCAGGDGQIEIQVSGDVGGLLYSIDNGATAQASPIFTGLNVGTYYILVIDNNNCPVGSIEVLSNANAPIIDDIVVTASSCAGNDGTITITASGGSGGLTYSIDNGASSQGSNTFGNLVAGNYNIVVEDNAGCSVTSTATIQSTGGLSITNVQTSNPNCGASDGSITIVATGTGLQYSIDGGTTFQASGNFPNLPAGNYDIEVQDNAGCTATDNVSLNAAGAPQITNVAVQNIPCGATSGSIIITANGGAGMQYSVDNGNTFQSSNTFNGLTAGNYPITVIDNGGCSTTANATITTEGSVTADFVFSPSEIVLPDGLVSFTNLSTGADTYSWDFGGLGNSSQVNPVFDFSNNNVGTYYICLTASNVAGCSDEQCYDIRLKDDITVYVPNAFTPTNNDNINQTFYPISREVLEGNEYEFTVFSRWGEVIFKSNDSMEGWDGKYGGKQVPPDVYVWKLKINFPSLPEQVMLGHVNVLR